MDRIVCIAFWIILVFPCYAQVTTLQKLDMLIEPKLFSAYDSIGFSSLPELNSYCIDENDGGNGSKHNFMVIDLNQDGLKDLIFSGDCYPYSATEIFLNRIDSMELVYGRRGSLMDIEQSDSITSVLMLAEACCCIETAELVTLEITNSNLIKSSLIVYYNDTALKMENGLTQITLSGIIRRTPVEDDTKRKNSCYDEMVDGNRILSIDKPSVAYELYEVKGWKLVLYKAANEYSLIGWIKNSGG